jgi:hypothetical protein
MDESNNTIKIKMKKKRKKQTKLDEKERKKIINEKIIKK